MRLRWLIGLLCLLLAACAGEEPTYTITVHHRPQAEVQAMAPAANYMVYGVTFASEHACEIYLISREEAQTVTYGYVNGDGSNTWMTGVVFYEWLLGHEHRHCLEGHFH